MLTAALPSDAPRHLVEQFDAAPDDRARFRVFLALAHHRETESWEAAKEAAVLASDVASALGDRESMVEAELLVAFYLNEQHRTIDALRQVTDAIHLAESLLPDQPGPLRRAISTRALVRACAGDYLGARADYHHVLDSAGEDVRAMLVARLNVSAMQIEVGNGKSALHHASACRELLRALGELPESHPNWASPAAIAYFASGVALNEASAACLVADHLQRQHRYEHVPTLLEQARAALAAYPEHLPDAGGSRSSAYWSGLAAIARLEGDHTRAVELARQGVDEELRTSSATADSYIELAKAYEAAGQVETARGSWQQAHALVVRARNSARSQHLLEQLARVSEVIGDLRAALAYTREALSEAANSRALLDEMTEVEATASAIDGTAELATWRDRLAMAERDASVDPLTGLLNRRGFDRAVTEAMQRPEPGRWVLALLDVDHFKSINDLHSHETGDTVLVRIADCLRAQHAPLAAHAARYGGEEFAVALEVPRDVEPEGFAVAMFEVLRADLARMTGGLLSSRPSITVSVGATTLGHEALGDALRRADEALYEAKRAGRDRVCWDGAGERRDAHRELAR